MSSSQHVMASDAPAVVLADRAFLRALLRYVRRLERDVAEGEAVRRIGPGAACCIQRACVLQGALGDASAAFFEVLNRMSLADLIRPKRRLSALLQMDPAA
jgi:DNA-binding IscR family transcriptional regulator